MLEVLWPRQQRVLQDAPAGGCTEQAGILRLHQERQLEKIPRRSGSDYDFCLAEIRLSTLHRTRNPLFTGEICGITKHTVDVLLRLEYARLSRKFSAWKMQIIHSIATFNLTTAMHKYRLSEAEVYLIKIMHTQNLRAAWKAAQLEAEKLMLTVKVVTEGEKYEAAREEAEFEAKAAWRAKTEDERLAIVEVIRHAKSQMRDALESAKRTSLGRFKGELTRAQYVNSERYTYHKWVYDAAIRIPRDAAVELFGDLVAKFIELVRHTQRCRDERRRTMRDRIRDGFKTARQVVLVAKRGVVWSPSLSTGEVVEMMTTRAEYQFAKPAAA